MDVDELLVVVALVGGALVVAMEAEELDTAAELVVGDVEAVEETDDMVAEADEDDKVEELTVAVELEVVDELTPVLDPDDDRTAVSTCSLNTG
jgi:hypothetical protein